MKKYILFFIGLSFLSACTTVKYNGAKTTFKELSYPEEGSVAVASIGDELLTKGKLVQRSTLIVHDPVDGFAYQIPAKSYDQIGYDSNQEFFSSLGVTKNALADPHHAMAISVIPKQPPEICVITVLGGDACYDANFSKGTKTSMEDNSFQQTLIYSGRIGDKINVGYREFNGRMARPAFNNDVEYDLSASNLISYKGAMLEIIEAGNNSIKYRVISNFR